MRGQQRKATQYRDGLRQGRQRPQKLQNERLMSSWAQEAGPAEALESHGTRGLVPHGVAPQTCHGAASRGLLEQCCNHSGLKHIPRLYTDTLC